MELSTPVVFEPLFMERLWGGRRLETLFGKRLPQGTRFGESWEIVDRPEAQSVVHEGPLRGTTLHELWKEHRELIFGQGLPDTERFPLLIKMLDAQERLSVQVHPPPAVAEKYGGEPKTEMWYVVDALLESDLYVGLKPGVTRESFEKALNAGQVADQIHRIRVKKGDCIFMPSGRVHAIGGGNIIYEVQQNSDTTYRVFDWNRLGTDGRPRALHLEESIESIDFNDIEPTLAETTEEGVLAECEYFRMERWQLNESRSTAGSNRFAIYCVVDGKVSCANREYRTGSVFLVPPVVAYGEMHPVDGPATVLRTTIP